MYLEIVTSCVLEARLLNRFTILLVGITGDVVVGLKLLVHIICSRATLQFIIPNFKNICSRLADTVPKIGYTHNALAD
jgi:hypothetical protein